MGRPSRNGELANSAVATGCSAKATRSFLAELLAEKAVRKEKTFVAVVGMRVDARTRAAGELERFLEQYELPVLAYLRDTQAYVQAAAHGLTLFDLPAARVEKDLAQPGHFVADDDQMRVVGIDQPDKPEAQEPCRLPRDGQSQFIPVLDRFQNGSK